MDQLNVTELSKYMPIGNYFLDNAITNDDSFFAVMAYPSPGSSETTSKYVVYDRTKQKLTLFNQDSLIYANGVAAEFALDIYDTKRKTVLWMAKAGRGSFILDVERTLFVHSWWAAQKVEIYAVRHQAEITIKNNKV